jgi:lipoate-protein ligase A
MARDEALLASPVLTLRLYSWAIPALSLGKFQKDLFHGIRCVRRPSGGRALYHADEITYAIALPDSADLSVREAFCGITRGLKAGLHALGLTEVETCGVDSVPASRNNPSCMAVQRQGELTARGRKLAGSAQVRSRDALMQHGSLPRRLERRTLERLWGRSDDVIDLEELGFQALEPRDLAREIGRFWGVEWEEPSKNP